MQKEEYEPAEIEVIIIKTGDVITASALSRYEGWNPYEEECEEGYEGWNPHSR